MSKMTSMCRKGPKGGNGSMHTLTTGRRNEPSGFESSIEVFSSVVHGSRVEWPTES